MLYEALIIPSASEAAAAVQTNGSRSRSAGMLRQTAAAVANTITTAAVFVLGAYWAGRGSTIGNVGVNVSKRPSISPTFSRLPSTVIFPACIAAGNVVC